MERELIYFQQRATTLAIEILDKDLAELLLDIEFVEAQVQVETGKYTPSDLAIAEEKISLLRRKAEIARLEISRRGLSFPHTQP
jgi:hypothetical protein